MGGFWSAVGAIAADGGTLIAAVAASLAAVFTYRIMQTAQAQVKVSLEQNRQTLESERDAQLPVLMPTEPLISLEYAKDDGFGHQAQETVSGYDRNKPFVRVTAKNVGAGIALNIRGIVFEAEPVYPVEKVTGQHHAHRYDLPLEPVTAESHEPTGPSSQIPRHPHRAEWRGTDVGISGDMEISDGTTSHKLYAPAKPTTAEIMRGETEKIARLTFTYADIFGRKHAAIYDLTAEGKWENVAYLRNILQDLGEMQRFALRDRSFLMSPSLSMTTE